MVIADILEGYGVDYEKAYSLALEMRTDEMLGGDLISEDSLAAIAFDEMGE